MPVKPIGRKNLNYNKVSSPVTSYDEDDKTHEDDISAYSHYDQHSKSFEYEESYPIRNDVFCIDGDINDVDDDDLYRQAISSSTAAPNTVTMPPNGNNGMSTIPLNNAHVLNHNTTNGSSFINANLNDANRSLQQSSTASPIVNHTTPTTTHDTVLPSSSVPINIESSKSFAPLYSPDFLSKIGDDQFLQNEILKTISQVDSFNRHRDHYRNTYQSDDDITAGSNRRSVLGSPYPNGSYHNNDEDEGYIHDQLPDIEEAKTRQVLEEPYQFDRRKIIISILICITLVTVTLTVGIIAGRNAALERQSNNNNGDDNNVDTNTIVWTPQPTSVWTEVPTPSPIVSIDNSNNGANNPPTLPPAENRISILQNYVSVTQNWSSRDDVMNPKSAQYRALQYIANIDNDNNWLVGTTDEIIKSAERYALIVFYFGLNQRISSSSDDTNQTTSNDVAFITNTSTTNQTIPQILLQWKSSINFLNKDKTVCDWNMLYPSKTGYSIRIGILCDQDDNNPNTLRTVQEIFLPSNALYGTIPNEIGLLRNLKSINLFNNDIQGTIPTGLQSCTNIQDIILHDNNISSTIPSFLFSFSQLKTLNLANNALTGNIPIDLSSSTSQIHDTLQVLDISNNNIKGNLQLFGYLNAMQTLIIARNQITGELTSDLLSSLPNLEVFDISSNQIGGYIPSNLFSLANLIVVDVHNNLIAGQLPETISIKNRITYLGIHENYITGPVFDDRIVALKHLQYLDVSDNEFTGVIDGTTIGQLTTLQYFFTAFNNKLTAGTIPTEIGYLTNLHDLSFQSTNRIGTIPMELYKCKNLVLLDLNENSLTGTLPTALGSLRHLQFLTIKDNPNISGKIPHEFVELEHIQTLVLYGTNLTSGTSPLCSDIGGIADTIKEFVMDCSILTDSPTCSCCTNCCESNDYSQSDCSHTIWYSDIDPMEKTENYYNPYERTSYYFNESDIMYPALQMQNNNTQYIISYYNQFGITQAGSP